MVKLHIRAVFLWSGWSQGEKLPLSVLWPLNLIHVGYLRPVVLWYINPDRGGGFTSTGIPGESHCLNVSVFGSSDPVVRSRLVNRRGRMLLYFRRRWFYTAGHPWGEPLLACLCHQKGRWFYDCIVQNAALHAFCIPTSVCVHYFLGLYAPFEVSISQKVWIGSFVRSHIFKDKVNFAL